MLIRSATPDDIPAMIRLEQQASTAAHWSERDYDALFLLEAPPRIAIVAENERGPTRVVAFVVARCGIDEWEIENVAVASDHRRRGMAERLIGAVLDRAASTGVASVVLEVRESNRAAVQLYQKLGFTQEGLRRGYYRNPVENACLLRRRVKDL